MAETWAIVLAAGESKRMGTQKLLLPYEGSTIIKKVVSTILDSGITNVMVVLGSHREAVRDALKDLPVNYCFNRNYKEGMFTSVCCGIKALPCKADAAIIFLGDQPFIPGEVIKKITSIWQQAGKGIVIPVFEYKRGHPILLDMKYRQEILSSNPGTGLRSLSIDHPDDVYQVDCSFPEITRDIDTETDYLNELKLLTNH